MRGFINIPIAILIGIIILGGGLASLQQVKITDLSEKIEDAASQPARFGEDDLILGAITKTGDFPTSTTEFQDGDIINAGDFNAIQSWLGIRNATDTDSIAYKLINTLSEDPGHLHTTTSITDIDYVKQVAEGGTATTTFIKGLVIASGTDPMSSVATNGEGSLAIASGTEWVANTITAGTNITVANLAGSITISAGEKFGGDGSYGTLTATTTVIDLTLSSTKVFNFSSLTVAGTSTITFINPHNSGTVVIFKVRGNAEITCSSAPCIDLQGMGAVVGTNPSYLVDISINVFGAGIGGGARYANAGLYPVDNNLFAGLYLVPSAAGGIRSAGNEARGSGAFYMEVSGSLNFSTADGIRTAGEDGRDGGDGGVAGAPCVIKYNSATDISGTCNDAGGDGILGNGSKGGGGSYGGAGGSGDNADGSYGGGGANPGGAGANFSSGTGAPSTGGLIKKTNQF